MYVSNRTYTTNNTPSLLIITKSCIFLKITAEYMLGGGGGGGGEEEKGSGEEKRKKKKKGCWGKEDGVPRVF